MRTINGIRNIKTPLRKSVVTIGVFDGVHKGHALIIKKVIRQARRIRGKAVVLTFDPHPYHVLRPKDHPPRIMSLSHKLRIFEELGVDACVVIKFNRRFSILKPERFVKDILVDKLNTSEVLVGEGFAFGGDKKGTLKVLRGLGKKYGFSVKAVKLARVDKRVISSSRIRQLISHGNLVKAVKLLGRPVSVLGTVTRGYGRGRIIGFPTANIDPHHEVIPPSGVYAVKIKLQNKVFSGILNIGRCPTFESYGEIEPTIEVHIFNFKRDIYGKDLEILFIKKIREEKCFLTKEDLIKQIRRDERRVRSEIG